MDMKFKHQVNDYSKKDTLCYLMKFSFKSLLIGISCSIICIILMFVHIYSCDYSKKAYPLYDSYIIVSPSMVPTINVNDAVIIKRVSGILNIGDIITFSSINPSYNNLIITHRIVGSQILDNGNLIYRTKGDNNKSEDSSIVLPEKIHGKVLMRIPKIGYIKEFLKMPFGFSLLIILPILLIIYINSDRFKQYIKEKI